jgi:hypothetical protein
MKPKHLHKYLRVKLGSKSEVGHNALGEKILIPKNPREVFRCQFPDCHSTLPRQLAIGCTCQCWKCGGELVLDAENTKLKKPTHKMCRKRRIEKLGELGEIS